MPSADPAPATVVCVDFGSTFTKASLVDLAAGRVAASATHATTIGTDVLDGYDACLAALAAQDDRARDAAVLACSSAGGGLRIAVVGNEELVTAEAGRRVALSSGGKVVGVLAREDDLAALAPMLPDVVLLTGGTDGGNAEALLTAARGLVTVGLVGTGRGRRQRGRPRRGRGDPEGRGSAVRAGRQRRPADRGPRAGRRPRRDPGDVPGARDRRQAPQRPGRLRGDGEGRHPRRRAHRVELLARGLDAEHPGAGDVVVVDVGGATTDVHSVVDLDPEDAHTEGGLAREVVASTPVTRTVEGDLGMRWSAVSTVAEAGLDGLAEAARRRRDDPALLPDDDAEADVDEAIARAAVGLALRRHAGRSRVVVSPEGRVVERTGKDLREVDLLVGSGGILRNGRPGVADRIFAGSTGADVDGGWQLPRAPRVVVDDEHVLAAIGLLATEHPATAYALSAGLRGGPRGSAAH